MNIKAKPFLKWAGGKSQLLGEIEKVIPFGKDEPFNYVEPFVGGGALLFWMLKNYPNIKQTIINDVNTDLINSYRVIKNNVDELIIILSLYESEYRVLEHSFEERKKYYYDKRALFNTRKMDVISQTAIFIFLNRTCFNGLYRVNQKGGFNVPQGKYKNPNICNIYNLKEVSKLLQRVTILNGDFEETIDYINGKTFIYFDPPYKPLSTTSNFTTYTKGSFNDEDQIRLKQYCDKINSLGGKLLLSNSDVNVGESPNLFFDELYKDYNIIRVFATRRINSKGSKRGQISELMINNYYNT